MAFKFEERMKLPAKWKDPCGLENKTQQPSSEAQTLTDSELLTPLIAQTGITYNKASSFKEEFVSRI